MCGIAGQVDWVGRSRDDSVRRMVDLLHHRGPDASGTWISTSGVCELGHARLSIVDLSDAGTQPMLDSDSGLAITFNGEIYNFEELRQALEAEGERFRSRTDTEVILVLYRKYGVDCLRQLRGMFAFAIWDDRDRTLFLARDRVGKKPLLYRLGQDGLAFASEFRALVSHPTVSTAIDPEALELYLQLQYVPAPWSIYKDIRKLPPAHYAVVSRSGMTVRQYWDVDYRQKEPLQDEEALDQLDALVRKATRLRMIADVPIGALLSGGVDSSLVVAMMATQSEKPIRTFSIGFGESEFNELPYAQIVADKYRTDHTTAILDGRVEGVLQDIVAHYGEPFADSSAVPSFHVSRTARQHVTVVMNGDGGDELLGGYPRYGIPRMSQVLGKALGSWRDPGELAGLLPALQTATSVPDRLKRKLLLRGLHPELQSMLMYADFWNDAARAELVGGRTAVLETWRRQWLEAVRSRADGPIDRMLWMDNRTYLPGDLLVKMDIASMHCGLEARSPLLDQEAIEFCARLAPAQKVRGGEGKYLLKKLAERYVPREVIYRPKKGFAVPLAAWLSGPLAGVLREVITDKASMCGLDSRATGRTLAEFQAGEKRHASRLWSLLMVGLWSRFSTSLAKA